MIYPSFWQKGNIIGLCAPSNSLKDEDQPTYNLALEKLGKKGLVFVESAHTFGGDKFVSAPRTRARTRVLQSLEQPKYRRHYGACRWRVYVRNFAIFAV